MPTAPGSDVIPLRKGTKQRLAEIKGGASYDDVLRKLIDLVPPDELADIVRGRDDARSPRVPPRDPEKQLLIARLAAERWSRWRSSGRVQELAPRLFAWRLATKGGKKIDVRWPERRGFAP